MKTRTTMHASEIEGRLSSLRGTLDEMRAQFRAVLEGEEPHDAGERFVRTFLEALDDVREVEREVAGMVATGRGAEL